MGSLEIVPIPGILIRSRGSPGILNLGFSKISGDISGSQKIPIRDARKIQSRCQEFLFISTALFRIGSEMRMKISGARSVS